LGIERGRWRVARVEREGRRWAGEEMTVVGGEVVKGEEGGNPCRFTSGKLKLIQSGTTPRQYCSLCA
jgi:hypothetical protein